VTAKNNEVIGMLLNGEGITVENAYIKNNLFGLVIGQFGSKNEITLDGDITVTNNKFGFYTTTAAQGTVYVTGDFDLNRNDEVGLFVFSPDLTIAVGGRRRSGSITACDNNGYDIDNNVGANFEGRDYTCDTTNGPGVPECKPCFPGCDGSSALETSQAMAQETSMGTFMSGNRPGAALKPMLPSGLP
jgi:hypothetical protein